MQHATEPPAFPTKGALANDLQARFDLTDSPSGSPTARLESISLDTAVAPAAAVAAPPPAPPVSDAAAADGGPVLHTSSSSTPGTIAGGAVAPLEQSVAPEAPGATVSRVKVTVTVDNKAQHERSRLGSWMPGHTLTVVHTECISSCPLAASAPVAAHTAGDGSSSSVVSFEVRRRFDDFESLSRLLKATHRGYFLPRLQQGGIMSSDWLSAGDTFLQSRRVDLQDYLQHVCNHPVVQGSPALALFLTATGSSDLATDSSWQHMLAGLRGGQDAAAASASGSSNPAAAATPAAAAPSSSSSSSSAASAAAGGAGLMMRMKASLMSVVQPKTQPELSADEQQLQQAKAALKEMHHHLAACDAAVRSLVQHMEHVAEDFHELGRALSHFSRQQEAVAVKQGQYTTSGSTAVQRGADLQRMGYACLRQHSLSKQHVMSAGACLVFLPDWHSYIPEVIATLQEREEALAGVLLLAGELREKQAAAAKAAAALGPAAAGDKKLAVLNSGIAALQDKALAAEQNYTLLRERNQSELARLNLTCADDFRRALGRFAAVQAAAAATAADVWRGVAEQFASPAAAAGSEGAGNSA